MKRDERKKMIRGGGEGGGGGGGGQEKEEDRRSDIGNISTGALVLLHGRQHGCVSALTGDRLAHVWVSSLSALIILSSLKS